ncbi:MAG: hypothetical protein V2J62_06100 [candidate division KSB1 bacterium]|nr:hypothetical protein [candidate division KSB1 bacterium]
MRKIDQRLFPLSVESDLGKMDQGIGIRVYSRFGNISLAPNTIFTSAAERLMTAE